MSWIALGVPVTACLVLRQASHDVDADGAPDLLAHAIAALPALRPWLLFGPACWAVAAAVLAWAPHATFAAQLAAFAPLAGLMGTTTSVAVQASDEGVDVDAAVRAGLGTVLASMALVGLTALV